MKAMLTLALGLVAAATTHAATLDTEQPKCSKGFVEVRVDRIFAGVVSYTTVTGKKGAMPQNATGARTVGDIVCLPAGSADAKTATSTK